MKRVKFGPNNGKVKLKIKYSKLKMNKVKRNNKLNLYHILFLIIAIITLYFCIPKKSKFIKKEKDEKDHFFFAFVQWEEWKIDMREN